mgnify:CR=1 FL=1
MRRNELRKFNRVKKTSKIQPHPKKGPERFHPKKGPNDRQAKCLQPRFRRFRRVRRGLRSGNNASARDNQSPNGSHARRSRKAIERRPSPASPANRVRAPLMFSAHVACHGRIAEDKRV